ncbi:hypothetical protein CsSME_00015361 [Camellia sinensis var. sinensis]
MLANSRAVPENSPLSAILPSGQPLSEASRPTDFMQLLAEDPSLKQFKSHKKSVWRLKRVGDVLTIIVVAEVLEIAWFGTDSEVLEIAWSGILVQDAVGSTISWPTHFIRFDYE